MEELRVQKNHLMISTKNLPEFYKLLSKAEKEAQQLRNTLAMLSRFEFDIEFSVSGQAEVMESASSTISSIPTK